MRILIAPVEVAGIAGGLKAGFDEIGVEATLAFSQPHAFDYAASRQVHPLARVWSRLGAAFSRAEAKGSRLRYPIWAMWRAWSVLVLIWALWRFDAFIFLFGNSLTNTRTEARLLRRLGKKVAVVYCGSDSRPPAVDGQVCQVPARREPASLERHGKKLKARIANFEENGFACVNSPFTGQYHGRPFANWFVLGVPRSAGVSPPPAPAERSDGAPLRILHSPSNPKVKGTDRVIEIVEALKAGGHPIELALLQNVTNDRVLEEIDKADVVVDQLYSDTPMASFAVEAAQRGKPVLVGGYSAAPEFRPALSEHPPVTMFVHPDEASAALERLVADADLRHDLGRRAEAFVRSHWSPAAVAGRYLRLLKGEAPAEWFVEPGAYIYVHGAGLPEAEARAIVGAVVAERGEGALQLDHLPALREAFRRFGAGEEAPAP
ncbi:MAG TPA: glycosyltransferase [Allosphingosinicella sp.]|jgi:hypothetical protein